MVPAGRTGVVRVSAVLLRTDRTVARVWRLGWLRIGRHRAGGLAIGVVLESTSDEPRGLLIGCARHTKIRQVCAKGDSVSSVLAVGSAIRRQTRNRDDGRDQLHQWPRPLCRLAFQCHQAKHSPLRAVRPCVVMAPGFGGTRDTGGLVAYAQGLAAAGLDVVLFDYRGFGGSSGSPRQLVSAARQRQDYHAAIAAARQLPGVDPDRIVLWGISYSGGHVVRVAAEDGHVAAVVSLTPAMDGVAVLAQLAPQCRPMSAAARGRTRSARCAAGVDSTPAAPGPDGRGAGLTARSSPHTARSKPTPRSRARAGATRCARAPRSRWHLTGQSVRAARQLPAARTGRYR